MKQLLMLLTVLCSICVHAQNSQPADSAKIASINLDITWHKTTLLIFPAAIKSADRGDRYVLAEKVKGVENVLKVKAGEKDFVQSNLQVITADGKVFSFTVSYLDSPAYQTLDLRKQPPFAPVTFTNGSLNSEQMQQYCSLVAGSYPFLKRIRSERDGVKLELDGIYIKKDVLLFRYKLTNTSTIPFDAASLRFYIRDRRKAKRTAEQDREVTPLYVQHAGLPEYDKGQVIVAAFDKFTIAESKHFVTELMEDGGDRNPAFKITERKLLKARKIFQ